MTPAHCRRWTARRQSTGGSSCCRPVRRPGRGRRSSRACGCSLAGTGATVRARPAAGCLWAAGHSQLLRRRSASKPLGVWGCSGFIATTRARRDDATPFQSTVAAPKRGLHHLISETTLCGAATHTHTHRAGAPDVPARLGRPRHDQVALQLRSSLLRTLLQLQANNRPRHDAASRRRSTGSAEKPVRMCCFHSHTAGGGAAAVCC